jgi:hypothetical protein
MKNLIIILFFFIGLVEITNGQVKTKTKEQKPANEVDSYTVQYLIIFNDKGEVLLQKNKAGWHTFAIRSNKSQSVKEAMDSLANSVGLTINSLRLAGLYVYKFEGLPDHKEASFRTHFTARLGGGELMQPIDPDREYRWVPLEEAVEKITFESLKLETSQILNEPKKVWGGTFLILWKDGQFLGSKVLEKPYPLSD